MGRPVIALLTDFGTRDHYAGTMKGVALGICPDATLVDISHDLPPHDVLGASLELAAAYKYFPAGTAFLVVVDPGVGSESAKRRRRNTNMPVAAMGSGAATQRLNDTTSDGSSRIASAIGITI